MSVWPRRFMARMTKGCVVVPAAPASNLVFAEPTLLLVILEYALDEVPLALHVGEAFGCRLRHSVREAELQPIGLARDDDTPQVRMVIAALITPHTSVENFNVHCALRPMSHQDALPCTRPLLVGSRIHAHGLCVLVGRRIDVPQVLIAMHVGHERRECDKVD